VTDLPAYKYLIVGGGMAADAALRGIREIDPLGSIAIICSEPCHPYNRPPLSKGLWKESRVESIWRDTDRVAGVTIHIQTSVKRIDATQKCVVDDKGASHSYEKLLLATGGTPRRLPFGGDSIIYFRTLADYHKLRTLAEKGSRFAVIGGGFIGSEITAALQMNGKSVIMIFPEDGICARIWPADLSESVTTLYRRKGVEVVSGKKLVGLARKKRRLHLQVSGMKPLPVDGIVAGLGIFPNLELAAGVGLETSDGVVVDEWLRTSSKDIYAAGDVAAFHNPALGKRIRVEHEDNANTMGRIAGRNMAGGQDCYDRLPFFYSDLFELGYEAVGELDPHNQTVSKWNEQFRQGIVYYLSQGRIRGVLLWNVSDKVDAARDVIAQARAFTVGELDSLIPL
jgi:3-phenylpropionate/trans-cinnamate dioxygenase ferredoxin reductase subunit